MSNPDPTVSAANQPSVDGRESGRELDRRIRQLAVPALGALVAEPLFVLVDSAMIGHLGATPLAGLSIASTVLQTAIGLMIFLAYATTPLVARRLGQGHRDLALSAGVDGLWLAAAIGVVLAVAGALFGTPVLGLFTTDPEVLAQASAYLHVSLVGVPAMLLVLAATGVLRGLQDTRTPLLVVVLGVIANIALNALLIYGLGWGIAGSAAGTVIAQIGMAAALVAVVVRQALAAGADLRPRWQGVGRSMRDGGWLFVRTLALRVALVVTVWFAASLGTATVAGYQVLFTLFTALGMAFDALAVAGQALIGLELGDGDERGVRRVRAVQQRLQRWGVLLGAALTVAFAAVAPWLGRAFTSDAAVLAALTPGFVAMGLTLPLAGYVFVLDGILIGAGDGRYLAIASVINLVVMAPWMLLVGWAHTAGWIAPEWSLVAVWSCFGVVYMAMRALTLGLRARGTAWLRTAA